MTNVAIKLGSNFFTKEQKIIELQRSLNENQDKLIKLEEENKVTLLNFYQ